MEFNPGKTDLLLIGGSDIDYIATSKKKLIRKDSNIGNLEICFGGVMRNIAENLARLGLNINFITPIGNDTHGEAIKENLKSLNINFMCPDTHYPTAVYIAIQDADKVLDSAVIDNRIFANLNWSYLERMSSVIAPQKNLVIDSNLDVPTISYILDKYVASKKIYVEGVSGIKIVKFRNHLKGLELLSCNLLEAHSLFENQTLTPSQAVSKMIEQGVHHGVCTNGKQGSWYLTAGGKVGHQEANNQLTIMNTNGCGDALFSGVVYSLYKGRTLENGVQFGTDLANIIMQSEGATSSQFNLLAGK